MQLYYIEHVPTKSIYTPNTGNFRNGRNWRRTKGVFYSDVHDAAVEMDTLLDKHHNGEQRLRIRNFGGFDATREEDIVGDGYIRDRDFRVVAL